MLIQKQILSEEAVAYREAKQRWNADSDVSVLDSRSFFNLKHIVRADVELLTE